MKTLVLLACISVPAFATVVLPSAMKQDLNTAQLVADIRIEEVETFSDSRFHAISRATVRATKIYTVRDDGGWLPSEGDVFYLETPGGEIGDVGAVFSGYPKVYKKQKYRATLRRQDRDTFRVAGFAAGLIPHNPRRGFSRNRTDGSDGSGSGPFLFWDPAQFPIPYYVSLPTFLNKEAFVEAIDAGFRVWRDPGNVKLEFLPMGCSLATENRNDGINSVIRITSNWEFDPTAIAITRNFYVSGTGARAGTILDTDILLNDVDHDFTATGEVGSHDVQNIVAHEVGHFIGLGHEVPVEDTDATMYALAVPNETKKRDLAAGDISGLEAAYAGVGRKIQSFGTAASCPVGRVPLTCLSVHSGPRSPQMYAWMTLIVGLIFAIGKLARRHFKDRFTSS